MPPNTSLRDLLLQSGIEEEYLLGIEAGRLRWSISLASAEMHVREAGNEEVATKMASALFAQRNFNIEVAENSVPSNQGSVARGFSRKIDDEFAFRQMLVSNERGLEIINAQRFEEAVVMRSSSLSEIFVTGDYDNWMSVDNAPSWGDLAWDFRKAAEMLSELNQQEGGFPVRVLLFLCRHYLELALKNGIALEKRLNSADDFQITGHSIKPLWKHLKKCWKLRCATLWNEEMEKEIEKMVFEFASFDPGSMAMRYPVDTAGNQFPCPNSLLNFNARFFMEKFSRCADLMSFLFHSLECGE